MKTTRMHWNPSQGIVDQDYCMHGIANLYMYIADSAVFPTSGCMTLAVRFADYPKALMKQGEV
jgi:choline dehydrogenase-like flavoprotein